MVLVIDLNSIVGSIVGYVDMGMCQPQFRGSVPFRDVHLMFNHNVITKLEQGCQWFCSLELFF